MIFPVDVYCFHFKILLFFFCTFYIIISHISFSNLHFNPKYYYDCYCCTIVSFYLLWRLASLIVIYNSTRIILSRQSKKKTQMKLKRTFRNIYLWYKLRVSEKWKISVHFIRLCERWYNSKAWCLFFLSFFFEWFHSRDKNFVFIFKTPLISTFMKNSITYKIRFE